MRLDKFKIIISSLLVIFICQGCIHEHPFLREENPTEINARINIKFNLFWERLLHFVEFDTRAQSSLSHKFIIEITAKDKIILRESEYLSDSEFLQGEFSKSISLPIGESYDIVVWYEKLSDNSESCFSTDDLKHIDIDKLTLSEDMNYQSAFAFDNINLKSFKTEAGQTIEKNIELDHSGARFEIIATDVKQFINDQKAALIQGDTFNYNLLLHNSSSYLFNVYDGKVSYRYEPVSFSGDLFFPFREYEELTIAQGFIFCEPEDNISMTLNVFNSALMLVTKTDMFSFPVKRGYITTIKGNFLTNYLDGVLSIDNIWEGEFIIDL